MIPEQEPVPPKKILPESYLWTCTISWYKLFIELCNDSCSFKWCPDSGYYKYVPIHEIIGKTYVSSKHGMTKTAKETQIMTADDICPGEN